MSFLCDYCSRSVGSRCVRNLDGVRVGGSCDGFAPTLRSIFGLRELHDLLSKGRHHIRRELREVARFNAFPKREANLVLDLVAEIPPQDSAPPPFRTAGPALVFDSPADRDRAARTLEDWGAGGARLAGGTALEYTTAAALGHAAHTLIMLNAGEFRVVARGEDGP